MKKIRAAVVGFGNIGRAALEALEEAPDFEVAGIVRRNPGDRTGVPDGVPAVADISELHDVDVAILAGPTRSIEEQAKNSGEGNQYSRQFRHPHSDTGTPRLA